MIKQLALGALCVATMGLYAVSATANALEELEGDDAQLERLVLGINGNEFSLDLVLDAQSFTNPANVPGADESGKPEDTSLETTKQASERPASGVAELVGQLFEVSNIVATPEEAGCDSSSSSAKRETLDNRLMIKTEHTLQCEKPELIDVVEVKVFELAPSLKSLDVDLVNQTQMTSSAVTPDKAVVSVSR